VGVVVAFPSEADGLGSTDVIDAGHAQVAATAERVAGAAGSTADAVRLLFTWVRDEVAYDMAPDLAHRSDWLASATLRRGYGFCQQKAVLLAALLRAREIPAGIAVEAVIDYKIPARYAAFLGGRRIPLHGLTIVAVEGRWRRLDATLDRALCERRGYRTVEYEPDRDRLLPTTDLAGEPHFRHLRELGRWPDVPGHLVDETLRLGYLHDPEYRRVARRHGPPV